MRHTLQLHVTTEVVSHPPTFLRSQDAIGARGPAVETLWIPTGLLGARGLEARLAFDFMKSIDAARIILVDEPGRQAARSRGYSFGEILRLLEWRASAGTSVVHVRDERAPRIRELIDLGASEALEIIRATAAGTPVRAVARCLDQSKADEEPRGGLRGAVWNRAAEMGRALLDLVTPSVVGPPRNESTVSFSTICGTAEVPEGVDRWRAGSTEPRVIDCDAIVEYEDGSLQPVRWARGRRRVPTAPVPTQQPAHDADFGSALASF